MPKLPGVHSDQFSIARLLAVELEVGNCRDQRLKKRLALDERQTRDDSAVEVQEIESEIDKANPARAIARGLGLRKARQPVVAYPAQFAVEIRGFRPTFVSASTTLGYLSRPSSPVRVSNCTRPRSM